MTPARRLVFTGPGEVAVEAFDPGAPGPGEVLVRTMVTALSAGTEGLLWRGLWPAEVALDPILPEYRGPATYPMAYGYAAVGRVEAVGPGTDPGWVGRLVFSFTGHRSAGVVGTGDLVPLPPDMSPEDGVFLAAMETALSLVQDAHPVAGETLGVWGLGTVGILAAAVASGGPFPTFGKDVREDRRQWARRFGVEVRQGSEVCDVAIEASGHPSALAEVLASLRYSGRVVLGSWYPDRGVEVPLGGAYHRSRIEILPSQVSAVAPGLSGRWTKARRLETALGLVVRHQPSRLVSHRLDLEKAPQAYRLACQTPGAPGQVLFTYE